MVNRKKIIEEIIENFRTLARRIMAEGHRGLERCPITPTQAQILFIVLRQKNISVKELAEKLAISSSAVVQLIEELVKKGYLIRKNNPKDHRFVEIAISETTKKQAKLLKRNFFKQLISLFNNLSDTELIQYNYLNKKILREK
jgi:DNA-binding MarR family transcriptional regulator